MAKSKLKEHIIINLYRIQPKGMKIKTLSGRGIPTGFKERRRESSQGEKLDNAENLRN
jgi:hypothetical protein